ncbi:MAG: hypothetical protein UW73_C0024G0005 [Microgenomates group bacterium GW2011_GWB1_44_8]|nr:MAG: hypothetical protein UW73_C0024G0005 [Microgenomates group bacterium GW2011_GWB1_44_8]
MARKLWALRGPNDPDDTGSDSDPDGSGSRDGNPPD